MRQSWVNCKRVQRLMRLMGLEAMHRTGLASGSEYA
jgi:hypothetical protein